MHLIYKVRKISGDVQAILNDLVTESGNIRRLGPVPRFSDVEVIALSMAVEAEEIDNENWLFEAAEFGEIYHNILILLLP